MSIKIVNHFQIFRCRIPELPFLVTVLPGTPADSYSVEAVIQQEKTGSSGDRYRGGSALRSSASAVVIIQTVTPTLALMNGGLSAERGNLQLRKSGTVK